MHKNVLFLSKNCKIRPASPPPWPAAERQ